MSAGWYVIAHKSLPVILDSQHGRDNRADNKKRTRPMEIERARQETLAPEGRAIFVGAIVALKVDLARSGVPQAVRRRPPSSAPNTIAVSVAVVGSGTSTETKRSMPRIEPVSRSRSQARILPIPGA